MSSQHGDKHQRPPVRNLKFLEENQVFLIDEALASVGDFGELHLVVENKRLRFMVTQKSYDVLKLRPGLAKPE